MYYRIDDIQRDARIGSGRSHVRIVVDVSFWPSQAAHDAGADPQWREDFLMDIAATTTVVVKDARGRWKRASDGRFINRAGLPLSDRTIWATETITNDVPAQVRANIARYLSRNPQKTGDHFEPRVRKRSGDAQGILDRADVKRLRGTREQAEVRR